jgi:O-antigen ligase
MTQFRSALALGAASTAIFASTSMSALWLAFDAPAARREFAVTCAGLALSLTLALGARARTHLRSTLVGVGVMCGLGAAVVAVVGVALRRVDAGAAAAALAILLPMAACGLNPARGRRRAGGIAFVSLLMGVGAVALLTTWEASAIGGLIVGGLVGGWLVWRADPASPQRWVETVDTFVVAAFVLGVVLYFSAMFTDPPLMSDRAMSTQLVTRRALWQETLTMVRDYPLTGSGLASSAMVMSSYVWLRHVPFHPHAHNLFLQVALQQGVPGLVGLIGMFVAGGWVLTAIVRSTDRRVRRIQSFAAAAGASLVSLGVAGLFESDLFGSALLACMLLPVGLTFGLGLAALNSERRGRTNTWRLPLLVGLAPLAVIVAFAVLPDARARWHANLGAVLQTQAELRVYRWPEWSIQDQLRRGVVDLEPAIGHYQAALALDPRHVTAHRRLGQIELSRGHAEQALGHLESATEAASGDRAARRLLAEAYAITGNKAEAISLWKTTRSGREELEPRLWWYEHVGATVEAARFQEAIRGLEQTRSTTRAR